MKKILTKQKLAYLIIVGAFFLQNSQFALAQVDYGSGYTNYSTDYSSYGSGYTNYITSYPSTPTFIDPTYVSVPTFTNPTYNTAPTFTSPTYNTVPTFTDPTYVSVPTFTNPTYGTAPTFTNPSVSSYSPSYAQSYYPAPTYNYQSPFNYGTSIVPSPTYGSNISVAWNQQNQTCWNGTVVPVGTACPTQTQTCPNGTVVTIGSVCPATTQTCWNGSVIPTTQACPAQVQTCWNGSVIPVGQSCPVNYSYTPTYTTSYVPPVVYSQPVYTSYIPQSIVVNNVVTSIPTQISDTSAKCNGIGLIANNLQSTGWFEYGETPSLGRTTLTANIGSYNTSPFSNVLANLKPNTTYYCRAGMSNSYGTVRGEIVKFTTKGYAVSYAKTTPTVNYNYTKKVEAKKTSVCTNDSITLEEGQKAITLLIEKINGDTTIKGDVTYSLTYKNISSSNLKDVVVKIALPQELAYVSATAGNYDEVTRNITVNIGTLGAISDGKINFTANVSDKAQIGKTIVTTGYIVYTSGSLQDEVTTYIIGTIMPSIEKGDMGAKKVIGKDNGVPFLPNSLIEWIALLAIIFILTVLGRSIYDSYKEDSKK